ncbi:hypothetical protein CIG75_11030 [Tumebacillus algifaecis]|uniref:Uncharacterized protein n=1 Tax=Tumebacillus algifaecis TaxID=1214604 RepID=A0A223D268_9BACL|nr:hypothetical protein [Tumebacillus algifaecis]ASS75456.1 hypothetical protein CIG75_11030 [Tumebacillus algifaecis]
MKKYLISAILLVILALNEDPHGTPIQQQAYDKPIGPLSPRAVAATAHFGSEHTVNSTLDTPSALHARLHG